MSNNPKLKKNGGEGTFVGNLLRTIAGVSPEILNILGTVTGVEGLNKLGDAIKGNSSISQTDKDLLLKELEKDIVVEQEISKREIEISKRWEYDMKFGSRLTRNIRPLVVANFTILRYCYYNFSMGYAFGRSILTFINYYGHHCYWRLFYFKRVR